MWVEEEGVDCGHGRFFLARITTVGYIIIIIIIVIVVFVFLVACVIDEWTSFVGPRHDDDVDRKDVRRYFQRQSCQRVQYRLVTNHMDAEGGVDMDEQQQQQQQQQQQPWQYH